MPHLAATSPFPLAFAPKPPHGHPSPPAPAPPPRFLFGSGVLLLRPSHPPPARSSGSLGPVPSSGADPTASGQAVPAVGGPDRENNKWRRRREGDGRVGEGCGGSRGPNPGVPGARRRQVLPGCSSGRLAASEQDPGLRRLRGAAAAAPPPPSPLPASVAAATAAAAAPTLSEGGPHPPLHPNQAGRSPPRS